MHHETLPAFRTFIKNASQILSADENAVLSPAIADNDHFTTFVAAAQQLVSDLADERQSSCEAFIDLVARGWSVVAGPLTQDLERLRRFAQRAQKWSTSHDLLALAGVSFAEDAYTELLAWALHPATHSDSALDRQAHWIRSLGLGVIPAIPATPQTQLVTDDGIPDLVLSFANFTVVVEAKTGSTEHPTPSGAWQTESYPEATRRCLRLPSRHPVYMVLLTADGAPPQSREAVSQTYISATDAIMRSLDGHDLPHDTQHAFSMLFSHMVHHAVPTGMRVPNYLEALRSMPPDLAESFDSPPPDILGCLPELIRLSELLKRENHQ